MCYPKNHKISTGEKHWRSQFRTLPKNQVPLWVHLFGGSWKGQERGSGGNVSQKFPAFAMSCCGFSCCGFSLPQNFGGQIYQFHHRCFHEGHWEYYIWFHGYLYDWWTIICLSIWSKVSCFPTIWSIWLVTVIPPLPEHFTWPNLSKILLLKVYLVIVSLQEISNRTHWTDP